MLQRCLLQLKASGCSGLHFCSWFTRFNEFPFRIDSFNDLCFWSPERFSLLSFNQLRLDLFVSFAVSGVLLR